MDQGQPGRLIAVPGAAPMIAAVSLLALGVASGTGLPRATADESLRLFSDHASAAAHCPGDVIVRIQLPDGFFLRAEPGYGESLGQVYICRKEAVRIMTQTPHSGGNEPGADPLPDGKPGQ